MSYDMFMPVVIERDGIRYKRTSVEVREDLHQKARENGWNMAALLNKALEEKVKKEENGWVEIKKGGK